MTNSSSKTGGRPGLGDPRYSNAKSRYNSKGQKPKHEQICFKFNNGKCHGKECPDGRRHVQEHVARAAIEEAEAEIEGQSQLDSLFQQGPDMN